MSSSYLSSLRETVAPFVAGTQAVVSFVADIIRTPLIATAAAAGASGAIYLVSASSAPTKQCAQAAAAAASAAVYSTYAWHECDYISGSAAVMIAAGGLVHVLGRVF